MKIVHETLPIKKATIKNNLPHHNFQNFLMSLRSIYELNFLFVTTLCYDNVDDYEFWRL
jgi:hypothetical protein